MYPVHDFTTSNKKKTYKYSEYTKIYKYEFPMKF